MLLNETSSNKKYEVNETFTLWEEIQIYVLDSNGTLMTHLSSPRFECGRLEFLVVVWHQTPLKMAHAFSTSGKRMEAGHPTVAFTKCALL